MISSKQLILENNEKRKLLNKENKKYYDDMLVYIRLKSKASERESEEILMELLDHLIDGQQSGKTAADIFGDDPRGYADELICELPKENLISRLPFFGFLAANFIAWFLITRGVILLILGYFMAVNDMVHPAAALIVIIYWLIYALLMVWFIFRILEQSLFKKKKTFLKQMIAAGIIVAAGIGLGFTLMHFLPALGPSFSFGWLPSLVSGAFLWLAGLWANKKFKCS
ncbi:DUF1129 family protein [Sporolactobacillus sp. CPB3-1]|uniref:DUF1129 family protein n=1 Tax=Sporolactobacillus mangiferae TaxID=2940498 RepID=A0ABT0MA10_9BACL|nr:DUF1129 family protein [Sporolactobacillus mangiferae]MCL1631712.1 DUF1129 family protein [Sporolactobacillus mangiferae]